MEMLKLFTLDTASEAEEKALDDLLGTKISVSLHVGSAVIAAEMLQKAASSLAIDALKLVTDGKRAQAEDLAAGGLALIEAINSIKTALDSVTLSPIVKNMVYRENLANTEGTLQ